MAKRNKQKDSYDENFYRSQMQVSYDSAKEVIATFSGGGGICRY